MLARALAALRAAAATGRDAQTVSVRRGYLRELIEAYDKLAHDAAQRPAETHIGFVVDGGTVDCCDCVNADVQLREPSRPCAGCMGQLHDRKVPRSAVEALAEATGAGWRRA